MKIINQQRRKDMKKFIILLALMLSSVAAMAEEKNDTVIITLQNGTEVRYTTDEFDRVQIIYNLKYGVKVYLKNGKSKDYLATKVVVAQYHQGGEVVTNHNRNLYRAKLLEYPHLAEDSTMNQLVIKSTADYGITFSLEWSYKDKANRWTCYQMHAGNMKSNVKRKDDFREDPEIPEQYRSKQSDYDADYDDEFDRGHLCPSADRLCSREQNSQTFFFSNMQPQFSKHNQVIWNNFEGKVRDWAGKCDTLYVVKAATIRSDQVYPDKKLGTLPVPKYFYMALLQYDKASDSYEAMALWTIHENVSITKANFKDYAISIDELEERTGIDFFCNLPDDIEDKVEKKLDLSKW